MTPMSGGFPSPASDHRHPVIRPAHRMAGSDVTAVYRNVIDEVITKSRHEFVQEGVDEAVLDELRVLWEEKLQQSGVLAPEAPRPLVAGVPGSHIVQSTYSQPPVHQFPGYYTVQARLPTQLGRPPPYATGAALGLPGYLSTAAFAAQQRPAQQLAPQQQQQPQVYQQPNAAAHYTPQQSQMYQYIQNLQQQQTVGHRPGQAAAPQQPLTFYQQLTGSMMNRQPESSVEERKRKAELEQANLRAKVPALDQQQQQGGGIPQQDGSGDGGDGGEPAAKTGSDAEEAPVDNLSDVPSTDDEDEEECANHCISQYTKVTRTKNRWKAQLLAGVLHLNGRDHVFHTAVGDFQF